VQSFEADWYSEGPQAYVDWLNNERRQDVLMEAIQTARKAGYQEGFEAGRLAERNGEQT
jgi:flagellar biosynthesis/type III secretory pathway protein FliH